MATVCIAGIARGIGKTAVAEFLLARLDGWHAARVRVADEIPDTDAVRIGDEGSRIVMDADDAEVRRLRDAGAVSTAVLLA
ncbi:MAG TPA: hypothetical protein VMY69_02375, partial [Phycisphaerae bacterium]|nr:hypothetical protein [Phycisphaerae bacterium]